MPRAKQSDASQPSVTVKQFLDAGRKRLNLELMAGEAGLSRVIIQPVAHRPGLALTGFLKHFAWKRLQVLGLAEHSYLSTLPEETRVQRLEKVFARKIPCMVFTRTKKVFPEVLRVADQDGIAVLRSGMETRHFIYNSTFLLADLSAPRAKIHGTMVDVAGIGVLIEGSSGVGKSETALGLIKRGHALVADDRTVLRRSGSHLLASSLEMTKDHLEIRGIGIIHVPSIFGISAVRGEKQVDFMVKLERRNDAISEIDRTGMGDVKRELLGVKVPQLLIPVIPGRDLVSLVETAVQEYKLRQTGFVAARELDAKIKRHNHGAGGE